MTQPYSLSCHCKSIRLHVDSPLDDLVECNCSTCSRFGAIHWYVKQDTVKLVEESRPLATYAWRFIHEGHHFCPTCGSSVMRTGYPDGVVALNACLIEDIDVFTLEPKRFDGRSKIPPGPMT